MAGGLSDALCAKIVAGLSREILVADSNGAIVFANARAKEALEGTQVENLRDLFDDSDGELGSRLRKVGGSNQPFPINLTYSTGEYAGMEQKFRGRGLLDDDDRLVTLLMADSHRDEGFTQLRKLVRRLNRELAQKHELAGELQRALDSEGNLHRELIHRVKNNLALLTALVSLRRNASDEDSVKEALKDLEMRIHAIRAVHDILDKAGEIHKVQAGDLIRALCHQLDNSVMPDNVTVKNDLLDVELDVQDATPLALLVNELITNAAKHAFPDGRHGTIEVSLQKNGHDKLEVRVVDDGTGMSAANDRRAGSGTRIMEALASQIQGTLESSTDGAGTHWSIVFPHRPPKDRKAA